MDTLSVEQRQRLGRLIRGLRKSRGLPTQAALGRQAHVSDLTIRRLENGQTPNPRGEILFKLDVALGLPPETLIGYAVGELTDDDIRRVTGMEPSVLPVWMETKATDERVVVMLEAMEEATEEDRQRAIDAAMRYLGRHAD